MADEKQSKDPQVSPSSVEIDPGDVLVFGREGDVLVRVRADGSLEYGGSYHPDDAAHLFWKAVAKQHPNVTLREKGEDEQAQSLLARSVEAMLVKIGKADIHNERVQRKATSEGATEHDRFMARIAHDNLEVLVHEIIEFSRALALRKQSFDA